MYITHLDSGNSRRVWLLQYIMRLAVNLYFRRKYIVSRHEGDRSTCPAGTKYVEFTHHGILNGRVDPSNHTDKSFLRVLWGLIQAINEYAKIQQGNTLYWRIKPELTMGSSRCREKDCIDRWERAEKVDCEQCAISKKGRWDYYLPYTRLVIA